ncbi:NB-ARC domain-containing protein [Kitasatospora sp. NBC_00240]|uniref:AfsR/SARP family transcriptional regulator n=1 Tax=Kitasatospora sp. NBC_00240 TaxID=2903567 RepID=UPI0022544637|nr:BTAD domain-containing putative transcriptional regulator [Kitasatospora sp. NBC_00240]MCX5208889.1 NB-ARC domain-containing protein [Kitasatospora sp. NBC_00240]
MTDIRISLLGPVRAWVAGREVGLGPAQRHAVLAALAVSPGCAVTTEELVDGLWGDRAPARPVAAVRNHVSGLRAVLEQDRSTPRVLVSAGGGYLLRLPADAVDLAVFGRLVGEAAALRAAGDLPAAAERLAQALDLPDGEPFAGVPGVLAGRERERFAGRHLDVRQEHLDVRLALGLHRQVVDELSLLAAQFPLHEGIRALLMTALYRCGRPAEALAAFAEARRLLDAELGVEPTAPLRDLRRRIRAGDPGLATPPAPAGGPPPRPTPSRLPPRAEHFTGRAELVGSLAGLLTATEPAAPTVAVVAGMGGVGKSALAAEVADQVRRHFPDGQLYVNLRGARPDPADPGSVLARFLRSLGVTGSAVPERLDERAALYRSLLAGRRILLVLDDARDVAQVRPLLPGSEGCAVLVTARTRLPGLAPTRQVDLDVLEPEEAAELFARMVGRTRVDAEPAAAREVLAACCHLPLAIRIIGARTAASPDWTLHHVVRRLADRRGRLAELSTRDLAVEACFRLSYEQLSASDARAFRLLAVPETPDLSLPAAAAGLALGPSPALDVLDGLVHAGLLEAPAPDRYGYHDLLRLFAQARAEELDPAAERHALVRRILDQALATAGNAYRTVRPGHRIPDRLTPVAVAGLPVPGRADGQRWLAEEGGGLLSLAGQALGIADCHAAVADLLLTLDPHLEAGFLWRELIDVCRRTMRSAAEHGDARAEGRAGYMLGGGLMQLGQLDEAEQVSARAAEQAAACQDLPVLAEILNVRAMLAHQTGRVPEAVALHRESMRLADDCGSAWTRANTVTSSVIAHLADDRPGLAVEAAEQGLAAFRALDDPFGEVYALHCAGRAVRRLGDTDRAISLHERGLAQAGAHGFAVFKPLALLHVAECHLDAGRPADAAGWATRAVTAARELHRPAAEALARDTLARSLAAQERAADAPVAPSPAKGPAPAG